MHMCVVCQSVFCYKFSLWEGKRAMCAMLRDSHSVKKSIQAAQTWSNSNSMHVDVRHETEQRFIAFLRSYASCTCVCAMSISASAMCAMLRYSHFVKKSIQAAQTWSNSNSMHVDVRHKTEQRFIAFLRSYASCTCVCGMSISASAMCAMLRYFHFVKKSIQAAQTWQNTNSMHVDVRHKTEQRFIAFLISYASCTCVRYVNRYFVTNFHCGRENVPCAWCCATPISSRNQFKPYKLDRIATACMLMCATRQNSVSLRFW